MRRVRLEALLTRRYLAGLGTAAVVVAADLVTKRYSALAFADGGVEVIPGFLSFTHVENPGGAFGSFRGAGTVIGVAAVAIALVVLVAMAMPRATAETVILGLILGGAVGNLVDRVARGPGIIDGAVVDWVSLWFIPTFNLADASITVAVALLLIRSWMKR